MPPSEHRELRVVLFASLAVAAAVALSGAALPTAGAGAADAGPAAVEVSVEGETGGESVGNESEETVQLASTGSGGVTTNASWPTGGFDEANTGHGDTTGPRNASKGLWESTLDNPATRSSVTMVNGTLYAGDDEGAVYALDAETGEQQWVYKGDGYESGWTVVGSPTVANGRVFVSMGPRDPVVALDADTGAFLWKNGTSAGTPKVSGGTVYVGSENVVWALDATTGYEVWRNTTVDDVNGGVAVAGGTVYVPDTDDVQALDATDGDTLWESKDLQDGITSPPTVANDTVYATVYDEMFAFDADTGSVLWNVTPEGPIFHSVAVANGSVYAFSEDDSGFGGVVYALDKGTGAEQHRTDLFTTPRAEPTVADGVVYVGGTEADVTAIDANTGQELWQHSPYDSRQVSTESEPIVVDGTVYSHVGAQGNTPTNTTVFAIVEPPVFEVGAIETNGPVLTGDTLKVNATIQNAIREQSSQEVNLTVAGAVRDRVNVTIPGDTEKTVTLTWNDTTDYFVNYTATVGTEDDTGSVNVTIDPDSPAPGDGVDSCTVIDQAGTYELTGSIADTTERACIDIIASDVVLDGQGHAIDALGDAVNITSPGSIENVTIRNLHVEGGRDAFNVRAPTDGAIVDVDIVDTSVNDSAVAVVFGASGNGTDVDLDVLGNAFENVTRQGIVAVADGQDANVSVDIVDNRLDTRIPESAFRFSNAIGINARGSNASLSVGVAGNHISSEGNAIDTITASGDDQTVDVTVRDNLFADEEGLADGVEEVAITGVNTTATVSITNNTGDRVREGVENVVASGTNATLALTIAGNDLNATVHAIETLSATAAEQTVDVAVRDNTLLAQGDTIGTIEATGRRSVANLSVVNNTVDAGSNGIQEVLADGAGQSATVTIARNDITAVEEGIGEIVGGGATASGESRGGDRVSTTAIGVTGNAITSDREGVETIVVQREDAVANVTVTDNTIDSAGDGVGAVHAFAGNQTVDLTIAGNDILSGGDGLGVAVGGSETRGNVSIADGVIVANGTAVDYRPRAGLDRSVNATVRNVTVGAGADRGVSVRGNGTLAASGVRFVGAGLPDTVLSFDATSRVRGNPEESTPPSAVAVRPVSDLTVPPEDNRSVFQFVDVNATANATLADVTIQYNDAAASNLDEPSLRGWTYDGSEWTERAGGVDTAANVVTVDALTNTSGWVTLAPLGPSTDPEPTYAVSVNRTTVQAREIVAITVTATNDGGEMLDRITLTRNGEVVESGVPRLGANSKTAFVVNQTFRYPSPDEAVFEFSAVGTSDTARVTLAGADRPPQPDWTGWHLPAENDNHDAGLVPPRPPLSMAWNTSAPDGISIPMKPLVVDGTLYAYTYEGAFAMDAITGDVLWNNSDVNGTYLGGMVHENGTLVVSTSDQGLKGLDASTGAIVWTRSDIDTSDSAPTVLNGTVFVGGEDASLWAIDAATGATVWNHTYATNSLPADFSSPTAANGRVFVPGSDGTLYAHDADNGSMVWTRDIGYSEATPAVNDGIVYAADSGEAPYLQALDAETGETVWNATAEFGYTGLAVTDDTVFMATCGDSMYAYNATTGELRWNRSGLGCAYDVSDPVVASGIVYSTVYRDRTLALDAATGETVYDIEMPGCCKGTSPVPYEGRLYIADRYDTGEVYAFGGPEWPRVTPNRTLINESTTLTVRGEYSEDPIPNATLRIGDTTLTTDDNGTVAYTFESGGTREIVVTGPDTNHTNYVETRRTITVGVSGFAVSVDSTNAPITEGETLQVNATIENTGTSQQTQTVALSVGGAARDSVTVTLAPGGSQPVSLSWNTTIGDGDVDPLSARVTSENDSDSTPVTIRPLEPANFSVRISGTNSPIEEGDTLNVSVNVTNTGELQGTQMISLSVAGTQRDSTPLTLGPGATRIVSLSWATTMGDGSSNFPTAEVTSENDSDSTSVFVEPLEAANFSVRISGTNSPIEEGETLNVSVNVTNTGDLEGTQTIDLSVAGTQRDSTSLTLGPGATRIVSLSWATTLGDGSSSFPTAEVTSENDSDSTSVFVEPLEPANFSVRISGTNSPIEEGDTLNVSINVTNTGDLQGTQTISLSVAGTQRDSTSLTLGPGATRIVSLSWATTTGDGSSNFLTAEATSENDSDSTPVKVESSRESTDGPTIAPGQPGFGPVIALLGLVAVVIFASRRRGS